jgi:hypothetical protein
VKLECERGSQSFDRATANLGSKFLKKHESAWLYRCPGRTGKGLVRSPDSQNKAETNGSFEQSRQTGIRFPFTKR